MNKTRIFIAGHRGMVGSALLRLLKNKKVEIITKNRSELNLLSQKDVQKFFKHQKIDQLYLAAAKVGGIHANNSYPAEFIYENLMIQNNLIHNAFLNGVKKLLFLGSSCIYPKNAKQPMSEDQLLTDTLESTNEPYAISKIAGIKLCESYNRQYGKSHGIDYRSIMPTNLYGPGDYYHPKNSHVIPGLIYRFHKAKIKNQNKVNVWGLSNTKREFLYVDDIASAAIHLMDLKKRDYDKQASQMCSHINVGSGIEITIRELALTIKEVVDFKGKINFDPSLPIGSKRKLLDSSKINKLGWKPKVRFKVGLVRTYKDFLKRFDK